LFQGEPGARAFRRYLADHAWKKDADADVLRRAADLIGPATRDETIQKVRTAIGPAA
jgi:hypothetical protein